MQQTWSNGTTCISKRLLHRPPHTVPVFRLTQLKLRLGQMTILSLLLGVNDIRAWWGELVGLVTCTRPDLAPVHTFLSSYNHNPSQGHLNAAKHVLHYIHSTYDYGITFSSKNTAPMHTHVHFPDSTDREAYSDATPPTAATAHKMTTYSDACWGGQYGKAV